MHPLIPYFDPPELTAHIKGVDPAHAPGIHAFGVLVLIAFLVGSQVAAARAKRSGLDPDPLQRLVGWLVVGVFVGGHVGNELMYEPQKVIDDPTVLLRLWDGLASFGGFMACIPITYVFFRREGLPFWRYADCLAYGLSIGWFFARVGCFTAHDHPGSPTNFWLGVYGICPGRGMDVACHDMGLYEALWAVGVFGLFTAMSMRARVPGVYVAWLGILYGPARLAMDFYRPLSTDTRYLGLTPAQYLSIALCAACAGLLVARVRSEDAVWPTDGPFEPNDTD